MRRLQLVLILFLFGCSSIQRQPDCETRGPATNGDVEAACGGVYGATGSPLKLVSGEQEKLTKFRRMLRQVLKRTPAPLKLESIQSDEPVDSNDKALKIFGVLLDPTSALSRELAVYIEKLGGIASPDLWNLYFKAYDRIVAFSDGYLTLFQMADRVLPQRGTIGDFGAGSGNGSSVLASGSAGRKVIAMDHSAEGLATARKKLELATGGDSSRFETRQMDISKVGPEANSLDGAIMNNVLYTIAAKEELLARVFTALKPGGLFILNDPAVQNDPAKLKKFYADVIFDAVRNEAPITSFDVAIVGAINIQVLSKSRGIFLTAEAMQELATKAGFQVRGSLSGYHGSSTYLILQKP